MTLWRRGLGRTLSVCNATTYGLARWKWFHTPLLSTHWAKCGHTQAPPVKWHKQVALSAQSIHDGFRRTSFPGKPYTAILRDHKKIRGEVAMINIIETSFPLCLARIVRARVTQLTRVKGPSRWARLGLAAISQSHVDEF